MSLNKIENMEQIENNEKELLEGLVRFFKDWCKSTKRSGGVLVGKSINEFFEYAASRYSLSPVESGLSEEEPKRPYCYNYEEGKTDERCSEHCGMEWCKPKERDPFDCFHCGHPNNEARRIAAASSKPLTEQEIKEEAERLYPLPDRKDFMADRSLVYYLREAFIAGAALTAHGKQPELSPEGEVIDVDYLKEVLWERNGMIEVLEKRIAELEQRGEGWVSVDRLEGLLNYARELTKKLEFNVELAGQANHLNYLIDQIEP